MYLNSLREHHEDPRLVDVRRARGERFVGESVLRLRAIAVKRMAILVSHIAVLTCGGSAVADQDVGPKGDTNIESFELRQNERVVMLGNGYFERDAGSSYLETLLTCRYYDGDITFRNLGWPGDTVNVQLRPRNFPSLQESVAAQRPNVIFVTYGMNEAFDGDAGLEPFRAGYEAILDMLKGDFGTRSVLLSPTRHFATDSRISNLEECNANAELYAAAVHGIALERDLPFVDLFGWVAVEESANLGISQNGFHLSELGYWLAGILTEHELGLKPPEWSVAIDVADVRVESVGTTVTDFRKTDEGVIFSAMDERLPQPSPPAVDSAIEKTLRRLVGDLWSSRLLRVSGLPAGRYALTVDGELVVSVAAEDLAQGVLLNAGPEYEQVEALRRVIVDKSRQFFYQWRAHNAEYIFGRRSGGGIGGESGRVALNGHFKDDMDQLEAMVVEREREIASMAAPLRHNYELRPEGEK